MSKSSIYENAWLDLVFDGKNKEYGAYQLRRENTSTAFKALFTALVLLTALSIVTILIGSLKAETITEPQFLSPTIEIRDIIQPVQPPKQQPPKTNTLPPAKPGEPKPTMSQPVVTDPEKAKPDVPQNSNLPANSAGPEGVPGGTATVETPSSTAGESPVTVPAAGNSTYTTATVDKMPTYPGGMDGFYRYVGKNFRTPEEVLTSGSTVKVLVSFVIEKDGTMTDIKVSRNPGYGLDKEAIRVLKSMKLKWEPGSIKGQPVRVVYNLPIAVKVP